jgi:hypothetical protein
MLAFGTKELQNWPSLLNYVPFEPVTIFLPVGHRVFNRASQSGVFPAAARIAQLRTPAR